MTSVAAILDRIRRTREPVGLIAGVLREFACLCAEDALALTSHQDPRSVAAVATARAFARGEIGEEELRAARHAAWDAFCAICGETELSSAAAPAAAHAACFACDKPVLGAARLCSESAARATFITVESRIIHESSEAYGSADVREFARGAARDASAAVCEAQTARLKAMLAAADV